MKSNINQKPLRTYPNIPKKWELRPDVFGDYSKLLEVEHYADGWRDVVVNSIGKFQQRGQLYYDQQNDVVTYQVIDMTPEQIEQIRLSKIPFEIKPSQGKIQLHRMGLLSQVNQIVESSEDMELKLFWEYALTWERENSYIQSLAGLLGMNQTGIEDFFTEASGIN